VSIEAYLFLSYQPGWNGSPDRIAQMRAQAEQYDQHNLAVAQEYHALYCAFRAAAEKIERKSEMRCTGRQRYSRMQNTPRWDAIVSSEPHRPLSNKADLESKLESAERDRAREMEAAEAKERERQKKEAAQAKAGRAAAYLIALGWKIDRDSWIDPKSGHGCGSDAVGIANDIALDVAIEDRKKEIAGGHIEFGGDDNCENCSGWDGDSHRCECGNRRVSWEHDGDFESMNVWAEAY